MSYLPRLAPSSLLRPHVHVSFLRPLPYALAALAAASPLLAQAPGYRGPDARQIRAEYRAEVISHVNDALHLWAEAWTADDVETLTGLYLEEALLLVPGEAPVQGAAGIQSWLRESLPRHGRGELHLQDFDAAGGMAMAYSTYRIQEEGGGERQGKVISVFLLQGNRWRIRSQMFQEEAGS